MAITVLTQARGISEQLEEYVRTTVADLAKKGAAIEKASQEVGRSWSGSAAGYHGRLYYGRFEEPPLTRRFSVEWGGIHGIPEGWRERKPEEVKAAIAKLSGGLDAASLEEESKRVREDLENFQNDLVIAFAGFSFNEATKTEKALLDQLTPFDFGEPLSKLQKLPGIFTRDSEAAMQGITLASHSYYESVGIEAVLLGEGSKKFMRLADRLIRQLEAKMASSSAEAAVAPGLERLHPKIYSKCHLLYERGVYAEAAEKGFKVVRDRLRELTGYETGSEAFGKGRLYIRGAAASNVEQDFNDAVKFLTMSIDRFRNEKSHSSDIKIDDPARAYEYLSLSSLAMHLLDKAEIRPQS